MGPNLWPSVPADFRTTAESYIEHLEKLGTSVMKAIAIGLSVDESIFLDRIDKAFWNLRILGYEGRKSRSENVAGIGEHTGKSLLYSTSFLQVRPFSFLLFYPDVGDNSTDFGILTFLLTDSCKQSLQVLSKTGEWIWADPIEVRTCLLRYSTAIDLIQLTIRPKMQTGLLRMQHRRHAIRVDARRVQIDATPRVPQQRLAAHLDPVLLRPEPGRLHLARAPLGRGHHRRQRGDSLSRQVP